MEVHNPSQGYPNWLTRQPRWRVAGVVALSYGLAVAAGLLIAELSLQISTIWLASGIGLVAVLVWGYWLVPVLLATHWLVSPSLGEAPALVSAGLGLIAVAEITAAARLLAGPGRRRLLVFDIAGTARFALICLLLVPGGGALLAATWLWLTGTTPAEQYLLMARNWWLSVVFGIVCVVPLAHSWLTHGLPRFHGQRREALMVLGALLLPVGLILGYQLSRGSPVEALFYGALPLLLWASVFLRETGASTALSLLTLSALTINQLMPEHAVPVWNTGAHILAFGLMALLIANAQRNLEEAVAYRAHRVNLERLAYRDMLTGLSNRHHLFQALREAMVRWQRQGAPFAVLLMDLDAFKPVNDRHGHHAGDEVLRVIAARLRHSLKEGDLAARYGGDEFVLLLKDCEDLDAAHAVGRRLMREVDAPITVLGEEGRSVTVDVGMSVGCAHIRQGARTVDGLLQQADQALYQAKRAGKHQVACYDATGSGALRPAYDTGR
ncbi:diguanylate cyclase [Alkalilimnicola ehrlichii MLHE-1]|uniref:Diguanylate cyclase n=1 Tax=Alkalilimnicola ehrlichii (strain ATCC BAA-1101 / DSM 17681 / MLHE-1) TaxID=187272 RepID=Q0AAM3_ALKEH|nr:diguanylate cyclase [Alkalilimnicola ehrlichii]ABI56114.1 diguanylate cyclase [Alkalilimnicola ehrlichii MLHE-1]